MPHGSSHFTPSRHSNAAFTAWEFHATTDTLPSLGNHRSGHPSHQASKSPTSCCSEEPPIYAPPFPIDRASPCTSGAGSGRLARLPEWRRQAAAAAARAPLPPARAIRPAPPTRLQPLTPRRLPHSRAASMWWPGRRAWRQTPPASSCKSCCRRCSRSALRARAPRKRRCGAAGFWSMARLPPTPRSELCTGG